MRQSDFISGLSSEDRESALRQVQLWDGMTVGGGLQRALLRYVLRLRGHLQSSSPQGLRGGFQKAPEELRRQLQKAVETLQGHLQGAPENEPAWTREFTNPLDRQAMKLCRLLAHYKIPITAVREIGWLHLEGQKIEERAIDDVHRAQRRRVASEGSQTREVRTLNDLVHYVACQLFAFLDDWLPKASSEERKRVAEQIAKGLEQLGPDVQEEIRRVARLNDLTADTLACVGSLSAVGAGLAAAAGVGGFAVYATLSATIASAAGIIGLTLPFSVYIAAASLLACVTNPLVLMAAIVGGAGWRITSANRKLRAGLAPLLVAFAVLKSADPEARRQSQTLAEHLAGRYREFLAGDPERRAQLRQAFPAFSVTWGERACELIIRPPLTAGVSAVFRFRKRWARRSIPAGDPGYSSSRKSEPTPH